MKYFSKEVKIALTAIVAIVLLFVGLNFLKGVNVFKSTNTYYVKLADAAGLSVSTPVYANGYPVGIVRTIDYDYNRGEGVVVGIELDKEMSVPVQTRAELATELMGGVKMSLVLGPNPTLHMERGDTLTGGMHMGSMAKLEGLLPVVEEMLPKLDSIMTNLNRLTADPALAQTLHNAAALTGDLKEASAKLNTLMQNDVPQMLGRLNRTSANAEKLTGNLAALDVQQTLGSVNATLQSVQELSGRLNGLAGHLDSQLKGKDNTLGLFLNDRGVYDNLNSTLRNADSLVTDLKAHPKRYVHFSVFGKKDK
jgi:phospholipid/cholesterol/gamma-HCH transport system substrate-binding protein